MSADLYAAFMEEKSPAKPEGTRNIEASELTTATSTTVSNNGPTTSGARIAQTSQQHKVTSPLWQRDTDGSDVLFDAELADSGDEFGDFETAGDASNDRSRTRQDSSSERGRVMSTKRLNPAPLISDIPGVIEVFNNSSHPEMKVSNALDVHDTQTDTKSTETSVKPLWDDDWGDFEQTEPQPSPHSIAEVTTQLSDDEWEPIEDSVPHPMQQATHPKTIPSMKGKSAEDVSESRTQESTSERPNNVPPPSSLLQLLSSVFELIHQSNADRVMSKSELASKVLLVFRVSSRIVAGRSLRWKRDTALAQSVRIGQSGKSGGMKLAAVNKSEATKEERDTEEMIRDWSSYAHEFHSIITETEFPPCRLRISSAPPIKRLGQANPPDLSKQCALCGLKRTERLTEVDVEVADIFGEFWVEHWGHRDCFSFWYSYKNMLGHR